MPVGPSTNAVSVVPSGPLSVRYRVIQTIDGPPPPNALSWPPTTIVSPSTRRQVIVPLNDDPPDTRIVPSTSPAPSDTAATSNVRDDPGPFVTEPDATIEA